MRIECRTVSQELGHLSYVMNSVMWLVALPICLQLALNQSSGSHLVLRSHIVTKHWDDDDADDDDDDDASASALFVPGYNLKDVVLRAKKGISSSLATLLRITSWPHLRWPIANNFHTGPQPIP